MTDKPTFIISNVAVTVHGRTFCVDWIMPGFRYWAWFNNRRQVTDLMRLPLHCFIGETNQRAAEYMNVNVPRLDPDNERNKQILRLVTRQVDWRAALAEEAARIREARRAHEEAARQGALLRLIAENAPALLTVGRELDMAATNFAMAVAAGAEDLGAEARRLRLASEAWSALASPLPHTELDAAGVWHAREE